MSESDYAAMHQHMLVEIAATTIFATAQLGKAALARRVMEVMA